MKNDQFINQMGVVLGFYHFKPAQHLRCLIDQEYIRAVFSFCPEQNNNYKRYKRNHPALYHDKQQFFLTFKPGDD